MIIYRDETNEMIQNFEFSKKHPIPRIGDEVFMRDRKCHLTTYNVVRIVHNYDKYLDEIHVEVFLVPHKEKVD